MPRYAARGSTRIYVASALVAGSQASMDAAIIAGTAWDITADIAQFDGGQLVVESTPHGWIGERHQGNRITSSTFSPITITLYADDLDSNLLAWDTSGAVSDEDEFLWLYRVHGKHSAPATDKTYDRYTGRMAGTGPRITRVANEAATRQVTFAPYTAAIELAWSA